MTWLKDKNAGLNGEQRQLLLTEREELIQQIKELRDRPLARGDMQTQLKFRQQDLLKLAEKVTAIDRKLGR
jgi:hypothetical protein